MKRMVAARPPVGLEANVNATHGLPGKQHTD